MPEEIQLLILTAVSVGFIHTLLGPDHYLPFIMMSKAGKWSTAKTTLITILCGIGHVGSSVILGLIGIAAGIALHKVIAIESARGSITAWLLIAFGLIYLIWGIRKAVRNKPHSHFHIHKNGDAHIHTHNHQKEHLHLHETEGKSNMTPWIIFTIFVFGPCEPLIPLLMYPAAQNSTSGLILVTLAFSLTTISTMLAIVLISYRGINLLPLKKIERYTHSIAGGTILLCGLGMVFLGL